MAATVLIKRLTSTAPGQSGSTDITSINTRMKQNDTHATGGTDNPVPAVTTSYSFWITTQLECTVTPTTLVDNLRWFSDGSNIGTGLVINGQTATTYVIAASAIVLNTTNYTGLTGAPVDVVTLTSGAPKAVTGSISNPSTGYIGGTTNGMFVYQLAATASAAAGPTATETFTWRYDET
jgi:hypothetical protein